MKGWSTDQPEKIISKSETKTIATLINRVVDLDFFDERQEQQIFEHAVGQVVDVISDILPPAYRELIANETDIGIDEELARQLTRRLEKHVRANVSLPYLDRDNEKMLVQCVVELLVQSMREGVRLEDACKIENAGETIVNVFMKGPIGVLFETEERAELVMAFMSAVKNVPFVPEGVVEHLCNRSIDWVALHVEQALAISYREHLLCISLEKLRLQLKSKGRTLEEAFGQFDVDGDGELSQAELSAVLLGLGAPLNKKEQRRLCMELDHDGDGTVSRAELSAAMAKAEVLLSPRFCGTHREGGAGKSAAERAEGAEEEQRLQQEFDENLHLLLAHEVGGRTARQMLDSFADHAGEIQEWEQADKLEALNDDSDDVFRISGSAMGARDGMPAATAGSTGHAIPGHFARRVRQVCIRLLMKEVKHNDDTGGLVAFLGGDVKFSDLVLSSLPRKDVAAGLIWLVDIVLLNIQTSKLETVVHEFGMGVREGEGHLQGVILQC